METIHVKFDELTSMASECNNSGLGLNCSNFQDSLEKLNEIPLKKDLDNLFGPLYEDTMRRELTKLSSLEEPITNEPSTPVSDKHFDEPIQEDIIEVDGNTFINPFGTHAFKEAESSSNYQDSSNMHEFYQQHCFTDRWTKNHPIEQVIGDPSKFVTTRSRLHTDAEMRIWIESMQDELNQLKRLDVCELFERPIDRNVIKVKWLSKNKTDAENMVIRNKSRLVARVADHAGCHGDCKSISGGIQFLGDKLVIWLSKKQDCTAMSTAEAEYVSSYACCAQVIWMRTQLLDYGYRYIKIPMYCDSKSAISISCNPVQLSRTKHINIQYHFIKEHVEQGTIKLYFVRTEYQLADLFTKALPKERFEYLVNRIGMRCMTPTELERLAKLSS
ncbi:hypothetical protein Tco_1151581 [Tanacetum coccineum]